MDGNAYGEEIDSKVAADALKTQIATLQAQNKADKEKYEADIAGR